MANETLKILELLIDHQKSTFSIRKISQMRKINYKSAHGAVMRLKKAELISFERVGNTIAVGFKNDFSSLVFSVEDERRRKLLRNPHSNELYRRVQSVVPSFVLLVFGSSAKGTATKHSDMDVMVISDESKDVEDVLRLLPLKLHVVSLTRKEFLQMAKSKEFSVVSEAMQNRIILIGIEEYYRLVDNVKRTTNQRS